MDPNNKQPIYPSNDAPPPPASNAVVPPANITSGQTSAPPAAPAVQSPPAANDTSFTPTVSSGSDYTPPFSASNTASPQIPTSSPDFSMHEPAPPMQQETNNSQQTTRDVPPATPEPKANAVPQPFPPITQPSVSSTTQEPSASLPAAPSPPVQTPIPQPASIPVNLPVQEPQPMQPNPITSPPLSAVPQPAAAPVTQPIPEVTPAQPFVKFPEQLPQSTVPAVANPQLASVLTPPPIMPLPAQGVPVGAVPAASIAPAFTKKSRLPKILLFAALALLGISALGFLALKVLGGTGTGSAVGNKGELTWWGVTLDEDVVKPIIADYQSQHPDVKITYIKQSQQDYRERLTNSLASGKGPDIFEMHNTWPSMFKNDLSAMPSSVMSTDDFKRSFYPVIASDLTAQKGIVGMPLEYDAITLYVNEDIFSTALKTPPKTWIDMQSLADPKTGLTQRDDTGRILQSAVALGTTDNVEYWPEVFGLMMYQNKAQFNDLSTQTSKDVMTFYKYFGQPTGNWDSTLPKSAESFAKQKVAMILAPGRAAYDIVQQSPSLRFKTYPLPQLPKENPTEPDFSYATYWAQGVWERSASKEAAWDFLKFASSEQNLQKINVNLKAKSKIERVYPRPNMNPSLANHPILGSIVTLAPVAKSWYLADKTNDGQTGINTQLKNVYARGFSEEPKTVSGEITKILTQYGVTVPK
jgi:multiple sugar transport system substrate-binding protein